MACSRAELPRERGAKVQDIATHPHSPRPPLKRQRSTLPTHMGMRMLCLLPCYCCKICRKHGMPVEPIAWAAIFTRSSRLVPDHALTSRPIYTSMRGGLAVRIDSRTEARGDKASHAAAYALLSAAVSDVDSKKHKKDPFNTRYVELCLTKFGQVCHAREEKTSQCSSCVAPWLTACT